MQCGSVLLLVAPQVGPVDAGQAGDLAEAGAEVASVQRLNCGDAPDPGISQARHPLTRRPGGQPRD